MEHPKVNVYVIYKSYIEDTRNTTNKRSENREVQNQSRKKLTRSYELLREK